VAAGVVGKRDPENANVLRERLQAVSCGSLPCVTSDQLPYEAQALWHVYGRPEVRLHLPGQRGPTPTRTRLPPADLPDAQVVKRRPGGRVVHVPTTIIVGTAAAGQDRVAVSTVSPTITTSVVARHHLPCRPCHGRLSRTGLRLSTDLTW
jgi:hypothetical protein